MSDRDPFELLAALNPVPGLSERVSGDDAMLASIVGSAVESARIRRGRRRWWVTGGAVVVVSAGLAAAAFLRQESPTNPVQLVCYPVAEQSPPALSVIPMTADPVEACGELWMNGEIARDDSPPGLTACVLDSGLVAVIPGDQGVCAQLGFANWVGALTEENLDVAAFQEVLVENFADRCVTESDVEAEVRAVMAEHGFADWALVMRGGYTPERQCSIVAMDPVGRIIVIVAGRGTPDSS